MGAIHCRGSKVAVGLGVVECEEAVILVAGRRTDGVTASGVREPRQSVGDLEVQVHDDIWLVSFMDYDLGYFDLETRVLEPLENPFGPKVLPMS